MTTIRSGFDPLAYALEIETFAEKKGWEVAYLPPICGCKRPWFRRKASRSLRPNSPCLYVSSGVHGDEPAPLLAVRELLANPERFHDFEVVIFPLINPESLARGARENRHGIDCNRDYHKRQSDEVRSHIEALKGLGTFCAALCLHEDWEAQGVYLYENKVDDQSGCARSILEAMAQHLPIETASVIDGAEADSGVITFHGIDGRLPGWPESFYLAEHHCPLTYTVETPSSRSMTQRMSAHVAATEALLTYLRNSLPETSSSLSPSPSLTTSS